MVTSLVCGTCSPSTTVAESTAARESADVRTGSKRTSTVRAPGMRSMTPGTPSQARLRRIASSRSATSKSSDRSDAVRIEAHQTMYSASGTSVTNMCPGAWVIANGGARPSPPPAASPRRPRTPGSRPSARPTGSPKSGPRQVGDPQRRRGRRRGPGAPCTAGVAAGDRHGVRHPVGRDRAHRHDQRRRAVGPAGRQAGSCGTSARCSPADGDGSSIPASARRRLEGEAAADEEGDEVGMLRPRVARVGHLVGERRRPARSGSAAMSGGGRPSGASARSRRCPAR